MRAIPANRVYVDCSRGAKSGRRKGPIQNAKLKQRAYEHFDEWSAEDTYFSLDDELTAMREAKFHAECIWRDRPNTLLVGRKK